MSRVRVPLLAPFPIPADETASPASGRRRGPDTRRRRSPTVGWPRQTAAGTGRPAHDRAHHHRTGNPHIAISANGDPDRFAALKLPVLPRRRFTGEGPLAGLLSGLDWAAHWVRTRCSPSPATLRSFPRIGRRACPPPACAASNGRRTTWSHSAVACRDKLRRPLSMPGRRDIAYFALNGMRRIDFAAAKWDPFLNVNTPEDLARRAPSQRRDMTRPSRSAASVRSASAGAGAGCRRGWAAAHRRGGT